MAILLLFLSLLAVRGDSLPELKQRLSALQEQLPETKAHSLFDSRRLHLATAILARDPEYLPALEERGLHALLGGHTAEAAGFFLHALRAGFSARAVEGLMRAMIAEHREDEALSILKDLMDRYPGKSLLARYAGLLAFRMQNHARAQRYFRLALSRMDSIDAPAYFTPPPEDPLLLTPYNEAHLAYLARVTYADLTYGIPHRHIPGRRTDRGRTFIRYGPPTRIRKTSVPEGHVWLAAEIWEYPAFQLLFVDPWWSKEYIFPDPLIGHQVFHRFPENVYAEFNRHRVDFPLQVYRFRGPEATTRLIVATGIPFRAQAPVVPASVRIERGLFLMKGTRSIASLRVPRTLLHPSEFLPLDSSALWLTADRLAMPADTLELQVEFLAPDLRQYGTYRRRVVAPDWQHEPLQLSDLLLAYDIRRGAPDHGYIPLGDYLIRPAPWPLFSHDAPVYLYAECYATRPQRYRVEVHIQPHRKRSSLLGRLIGKPSPAGTAARYEFEGASGMEPVVLALDLHRYPPGTYTLTLTVSPVDGTAKVSRQTRLILAER